LAGDQRQQRHRLGLLIVQVNLGHCPEHGRGVVDQPRHQRLGGLKVVQAHTGLPGRSSSWAATSTWRACGTSRRTRRVAATSWVTVSWVATASPKIVESSPADPDPQHPVASTTWRTASKIRRGRSEDRRRLRQDTSTVGWKPSSSRRSPQATFQAMSRRNALIASRSDRPSSACSTITVATTSAGTDRYPPPLRVRSANSSAGNSC